QPPYSSTAETRGTARHERAAERNLHTSPSPSSRWWYADHRCSSRQRLTRCGALLPCFPTIQSRSTETTTPRASFVRGAIRGELLHPLSPCPCCQRHQGVPF